MTSKARRLYELLLNRGASATRERGKHLRVSERLRLALRQQLIATVVVTEDGRTYRFECRNEEEVYRARTLLDKEPGTVRWLAGELRPDDVFYDIGANIGLYTVYAGRRLAKTGRVVAFEPHVPTFHSLLRNIAINRLGGRTSALSCALNSDDGFLEFNYRTLSAGSSDSQLGARQTAKQRAFKPRAIELKQGLRIDTLLERGTIRPASLVKLDVDGNEFPILRGMEGLLRDRAAPRAVQVEANPRYPEMRRFIESTGYELAERHYTIFQQRRLDLGATPDQAGHNAIYRKP